MQPLSGIFRAQVEANDDPEQRKRFRVRVIGVHRAEVPVESLPWAELCTYSGQGFGDIPHYAPGDNVFVMFEGADRRYPVILGGWIAQVGGIPDLPVEQTGDYEENQRVWIRVDRANNRILMDPRQVLIELKSGDSSVQVRGNDGTIELVTDTQVTVQAPQVQVLQATQVSVDAEKLLIETTSETTLICEGTANLQAETINLGRYEDELTGALTPRTTTTINVEADTLINVDSGNDIAINAADDVTLTVGGDLLGTVTGNADLNVTGDLTAVVGGDADLEAATLRAATTSGLLRVESAAALEIDVANNATIGVSGQATIDVQSTCTLNVTGNLSADVTGQLQATAGGSAQIEATGVASLSSASKVELTAPIIEIAADSLLTLDGGGTLTADAGVLLIG